jgi:Kef-type K+ transport system membrane component KefB
MKKVRNLVFYIAVVIAFTLFILFLIHKGKSFETGVNINAQQTLDQRSIITDAFQTNFKHPLATLLIQIVTIIVVARVLTWICRKIKQPAVIGEILAGIILGPSLLGMYFSGLSEWIFPPQSLGNLQLISQIGLILFMFVIGMELDLKVLRNQAHEAVVISHASIIIPFSLGLGLAYFIYQNFAPPNVAFLSFGLFLGISLSITAFPVLARIVQERGIYKSKLGTIVITCAAVDDITAWSLLAVVIAIVKAGTLTSAIPTVLLGIAYVIFMIKVIKPFLKRIGDLHGSRENLTKPVIAIFFLVLLLSSFTTELIGIHALFGAFMAGLSMPENKKFKQLFIEKVEDIALVMLLPLFFVYTGLRTQIGLLNEPYLWKLCGLVIFVAIIGKFAGSALAAKFVGQNWRDSLTIGALMNTRGLVELVALNIGYDLGVLTPEMFSILVIMALVTTFMTSPALNLIDKLFKSRNPLVNSSIPKPADYRVLISFARPEMGKTLFRLAHALSKNGPGNSQITAMHLFPGNLFNEFKIDHIEHKSFQPIEYEARKIKVEINKIFKVSEDIVSDITSEAKKDRYDLLMIGIGHSIFQGTFFGRLLGNITRIVSPEWLINSVKGRERIFGHYQLDDRTRRIVLNTKIPIGILYDRGLQYPDKILVPIFSSNDYFLIDFVQKFIIHSGTQVVVVEVSGKIVDDSVYQNKIKNVELLASGLFSVVHEGEYTTEILQQHDLLLTSIQSWIDFDGLKNHWFKEGPSILLIKK